MNDGVMLTGISNAMLVSYRFLGEAERLADDFNKEVSFFREFF